MSKKRWGCGIIIGIAFGFLIWFVFSVYNSWPVYPAFLKPVDSYAELLQAFQDNNDIILPESQAFPFHDELTIRMNHRNRYAVPCGYIIGGRATQDGIEIVFDLDCVPYAQESFETLTSYRGINICKSTREGTDENPTCLEELVFVIGDYCYCIDAFYDTQQVQSIDPPDFKDHLQQQLLEYAYSIIELYYERKGTL